MTYFDAGDNVQVNILKYVVTLIDSRILLYSRCLRGVVPLDLG
jgi:hypothetical protein